MKKKYYLRGLGFGILITALVFCIIGPSEMTEEEIIKRAEELGYVKAEELGYVKAEEDTGINLKDLMEGTGTPTPGKEPETTKAPVENPEVTPEPAEEVNPPVTTPVPTQLPEPTAAVTPTARPTEVTAVPEIPTLTPEPTAAPTITEAPTPTVVVQNEVIVIDFTIVRGYTAKVLSAKLEEAGIIEHADALTEYFIVNEMTDDIIVGTYTLSSDMTLGEIADVVTRREIRE